MENGSGHFDTPFPQFEPVLIGDVKIGVDLRVGSNKFGLLLFREFLQGWVCTWLLISILIRCISWVFGKTRRQNTNRTLTMRIPKSKYRLVDSYWRHIAAEDEGRPEKGWSSLHYFDQ